MTGVASGLQLKPSLLKSVQSSMRFWLIVLQMQSSLTATETGTSCEVVCRRSLQSSIEEEILFPRFNAPTSRRFDPSIACKTDCFRIDRRTATS